MGLKTRSTALIQGTPCVSSRGYSFVAVFMKLCQNLYLNEIRPSLKLAPGRSKSLSFGLILEKSCLQSRGHSFDLIFMKLCQNIHTTELWKGHRVCPVCMYVCVCVYVCMYVHFLSSL